MKFILWTQKRVIPQPHRWEIWNRKDEKSIWSCTQKRVTPQPHKWETVLFHYSERDFGSLQLCWSGFVAGTTRWQVLVFSLVFGRSMVTRGRTRKRGSELKMGTSCSNIQFHNLLCVENHFMVSKSFSKGVDLIQKRLFSRLVAWRFLGPTC